MQGEVVVYQTPVKMDRQGYSIGYDPAYPIMPNPKKKKVRLPRYLKKTIKKFMKMDNDRFKSEYLHYYLMIYSLSKYYNCKIKFERIKS